MQGKVEICGVNTARLKVLPQAKMDALLIKAKAGDEAARQELIEGNLRLVLSVIQRFDKRGESPDDLFQVGCVGLIKAIANFDPTKNVRFSTYGVPMIAGEVRRYLRDNSTIRMWRTGCCSARRGCCFAWAETLLWRSLPRNWICRWKMYRKHWRRYVRQSACTILCMQTAETRLQ